MQQKVRVGTAGWTIPKPHTAEFPDQGSHLQRYAARLAAVEINSSFYRPHKRATYARWAAAVPAGFRFAVKVPREITHTRKLVATTDALEAFLAEALALGSALGPLLVQLPPSLRFDQSVATHFFTTVRDRYNGLVACEPRHATWFTTGANTILSRFQIARVAADPPPVPQAAHPGGWTGLIYCRLHGSPRIYYSPYTTEYLDATAQQIQDGPGSGQERWCIFDNTALGEATRNALDLSRRLDQPDTKSPVLPKAQARNAQALNAPSLGMPEPRNARAPECPRPGMPAPRNDRHAQTRVTGYTLMLDNADADAVSSPDEA